MEQFKISATGLSINYMPEYLAQELGYFEEEGLQVSSYVPAPWTKVLTDIDSGEYQAVVGGVWVPSIYNSWVKQYRAFAKVASRCPMVLVSRTPVEEFSWKFLEDKTVLASGGNGASPGLFLEGCAREGGADMSRVHFVPNFTAPMLYELFQGGLGDIIMLKGDLAAQMVASGKGYAIADIGNIGGPVPWSVYYSTTEFLEEHGDLAGRFTTALQKATTWLLAHDGYACREILARNWPKVQLDKAIAIVDEYIAMGMWDPTVSIKEEPLARWERFQAEGRVIPAPVPYDKVVDPRPFQYAVSRLGL